MSYFKTLLPSVNSPIPVHLNSLIPKMSMFTLAVSHLTTSIWLEALICGPNIPVSYAILFFTASDLASITSHVHNWVLFLLWLCLFILSGVILHDVGHPLTRGVCLSVSYLFAFSYCSWGSQGKYTEVVCHSLLQWTMFFQNSPPWPVHLGQPHRAWPSFIELDEAVARVIRLTSLLVTCNFILMKD